MGTTNILDLNNRLSKVEKENVAQNSYTSLKNKPKINNVTLTGNKSLADIGAAAAADLGELTDLTTTDKSSVVGAINELNSGLTNLITTPSANYTELGHGAIDGSNAVTVSLGANKISDYDFLWIGTSYYDTGVATYGCVLVPSILMSIHYSFDGGVCLIARDATTDQKPIYINAVYDSTNNNIKFMPKDTPNGNYYFVIGIKIRSVS